jgi:hypothetical protein
VRVARKNGRSFSFFLDFFSLFCQEKRDGLHGQEAEENQRNQYTNREQAQKKSQYSFNHLHQSSRQNGL